MDFGREKDFRRNEQLEALLEEINGILVRAEEGLLRNYSAPRYPVILLVGCARAGSTLTLQWLADTGMFAYPTNLLSRFYRAPYIGARIQQVLTDPRYNFRDEFFDLREKTDFSSALGKTRGTLAPNEFWYFWRRFFPYGEIQELDKDALKNVDALTFVAELAALEAAFEKPLVLKAHIVNWNIPFIAGILERVLFIHITRQPFYNAQSLLESRKQYFGTADGWYSFKPPEFEWLKSCSPHEQVAGQVYFTNEAVRSGLRQAGGERFMELRYEEFCKSPATALAAIREQLLKQDCEIDTHYGGPENFECKNKVRLAEEDVRLITNAYAAFAGSNQCRR